MLFEPFSRVLMRPFDSTPCGSMGGIRRGIQKERSKPPNYNQLWRMNVSYAACDNDGYS